jgi:predicted HicB family RNase H-like nuclease
MHKVLMYFEVYFMDKYQETKNKYKQTLGRMEIFVSKEEKERIKAYAKTKARSTNAYIVDLIQKDMSKGIEEKVED